MEMTENNPTPSASTATPISEESDDKKNRPKDTRLRQQKLPAWQPILTASTVIPAFALVGIVFIPIGVVLLIASDSVFEQVIPYTNCTATQHGKQPCATVLEKNEHSRTPVSNCFCELDVKIKKNVTGDVYFYYGLQNYYQNHRRYVKSRNDEQLLGWLDYTDDCAPYERVNSSAKGKQYAPCGAIANSFFNDTFQLLNPKDGRKPIKWTYKGITWPVDKRQKFHNPLQTDDYIPNRDDLIQQFKGYAKPPDWSQEIYDLDVENKDNNGFLNSDFIVWMRTAALPNFRKLYRKLDREDEFVKDGLPEGEYILRINYRYPVAKFDGKKLFIISTTSWAGAKNNFLGIAYIVVGSLCLIMGIVFLVIHIKFGKSLTDMSSVRT